MTIFILLIIFLICGIMLDSHWDDKDFYDSPTVFMYAVMTLASLICILMEIFK